jgi:hypothetical protein
MKHFDFQYLKIHAPKVIYAYTYNSYITDYKDVYYPIPNINERCRFERYGFRVGIETKYTKKDIIKIQPLENFNYSTIFDFYKKYGYVLTYYAMFGERLHDDDFNNQKYYEFIWFLQFGNTNYKNLYNDFMSKQHSIYTNRYNLFLNAQGCYENSKHEVVIYEFEILKPIINFDGDSCFVHFYDIRNKVVVVYKDLNKQKYDINTASVTQMFCDIFGFDMLELFCIVFKLYKNDYKKINNNFCYKQLKLKL